VNFQEVVHSAVAALASRWTSVPLWQTGEDQGAFIRSAHGKQAQPHRATGKANNELCRVERSCRGQAGAPAWR
jgi:hypothetical protein